MRQSIHIQLCMYAQPTAWDQFKCHMLIVTQQEMQIFEPGRSKMPSPNRSRTDRILGSGAWHCLFELRYHLLTDDWLSKFPDNKYFWFPLAHKEASFLQAKISHAPNPSRRWQTCAISFTCWASQVMDSRAAFHLSMRSSSSSRLMRCCICDSTLQPKFHSKALVPWYVA